MLEIIAKDKEASATLKKFFRNTENDAKRLADQTKGKFKDVALNISGNFAGAGGQIVESLGSIGHPIALIGAAAVGLGAALFSMAKRFAEGNAESNVEAAKFLVSLDKISASFGQLFDWVAERLLPIFNKFFSLIGQGATEQEALAKQTEIVAQKTNEVTKAVEKNVAVVVREMPKAATAVNVFSGAIADTGMRMTAMNLELAALPAHLEGINATTQVSLTIWENFLSTIGQTVSEQFTIKEALDGVFAAVNNGLSGLSSGLAQFIVLGDQANFNMKRLGQTIATDVLNALIKVILKMTLLRFLSNFLPGFGGLAASAGSGFLNSIGISNAGFGNGVASAGNFGNFGGGLASGAVSGVNAAGVGNISLNFPNISRLTSTDLRFTVLPALNRALRDGEILHIPE